MDLTTFIIILILHSQPFLDPLNNVDPSIQANIPTGINVGGPLCWKNEDRRYKYQALCTKSTETYYLYTDKKKNGKKVIVRKIL